MVKGSLLIFFLAFALAAAAQIPAVIEFFPQVGNDASQVSWAHRTNSKAELADAISDSNIMMIEADIVAGQLTGLQNSSDIPIMGHPPEKTSDLSLSEWVQQVIEANEQGNKKGAKLDIKEIDVLEESLMILKNYTSVINFPLWLNADILAGPGGQDSTPVDQRSFLTMCKQYFPEATLSIGWTTGYSSQIEYIYSASNIQQMANAILFNNIRQPITFPVRAALIKGSIKNLIRLMDLVPNCSFTIWSHGTDMVDMNAVAEFISVAGSDRVYVDIPVDQMRDLKIAQRLDSSMPSAAIRANHIGFLLLVLAGVPMV